MNYKRIVLKLVSKKFPLRKYLIVISLFVVWIIFIDDNNLINRFNNSSKLKNLKKEKIQLQKQIKEYQRKIYELETNDENLEKFARKNFFMKKPDEDIYIIETVQ